MKTRIAFQGEPGAFSEEAVQTLFGRDAEPVPCREFSDVGDAVCAGTVDAGLLPVENSVAGTVTGAYDVLATRELDVFAEVVRPIRHFLLGVPGASLATVTRASSHPVALAQCTRFLRAQPGLVAVAVYDTAAAARDVAALRDPSHAAVAGLSAASRYGLVVLAADIQDRADNQTRFVGIVRPGADRPFLQARESAPRKSMLVAETPNQPGALVALLAPFAEHAVNLTKIESRPADSPWTYRFFLELEGDVSAADVRAAIEQAAGVSSALRVLGCFPTVPPQTTSEADHNGAG